VPTTPYVPPTTPYVPPTTPYVPPTTPYVPPTTPYVPPTTPYVPPTTTAPVAPVQPAPTWQPPCPATVAPPADAALIGAVPSRVRLACERGREKAHFRALGGWAFAFGDDTPDSGAYAGGDLGYTFDGCIGIDVFYRYASARFDRQVPAGLLEDGGDTHHIGLKVTYEASLDSSSGLYVWFGIGPEYFWTERYTNNDDGFGGMAELGIGYLLSDDVRARLGVSVHGFSSSAGRLNAVNDGSDRFLWTVAPTLGIEIDF
jgi:hypothetical protein